MTVILCNQGPGLTTDISSKKNSDSSVKVSRVFTPFVFWHLDYLFANIQTPVSFTTSSNSFDAGGFPG